MATRENIERECENTASSNGIRSGKEEVRSRHQIYLQTRILQQQAFRNVQKLHQNVNDRQNKLQNPDSAITELRNRISPAHLRVNEVELKNVSWESTWVGFVDRKGIGTGILI